MNEHKENTAVEKDLLKADFTNPVLKGEYADPDLVCFDGVWYLYPTTDGFENLVGDTVLCVFI